MGIMLNLGMEQEQRRDNIIVRGVPESPEESTGKLVVEFAAEAGVGFNEGDLSTSFRISWQQQGKPRLYLAKVCQTRWQGSATTQ